MGATQPPVTASRPGPLCVEFVRVMRYDHGGVAHHALPGYPPAPSTAVARRKWSTAGRHRLIRPQCARAIGSSGPDQRSAACPRRFRDRRPPAPERVDDGPPRAAGKDHEARTHTAACTTGPVSHTDGNQPATVAHYQLSSNIRPLAFSVRHLLRWAGSNAHPSVRISPTEGSIST